MGKENPWSNDNWIKKNAGKITGVAFGIAAGLGMMHEKNKLNKVENLPAASNRETGPTTSSPSTEKNPTPIMHIQESKPINVESTKKDRVAENEYIKRSREIVEKEFPSPEYELEVTDLGETSRGDLYGEIDAPIFSYTVENDGTYNIPKTVGYDTDNGPNLKNIVANVGFEEFKKEVEFRHDWIHLIYTHASENTLETFLKDKGYQKIKKE